MNTTNVMPADDRRKFFRFDFECKVKYRIGKPEGMGKYKVSGKVTGIMTNISADGLAMLAGKSLSPGSLLFIQMNLPFRRELIPAMAEVITSTEAKYKGKNVYKMMLRFLLLSSADRNRVNSFVISRGRNG
jgi:c-di-GMP-binding flagellar brake protein YcgR